MKLIFADTYYYLALLNPRDSAHAMAVSLSQRGSGKMITTEWVLTEVADAFAAPSLRPAFLALLDSLEADEDVQTVRATRELFSRGIELYRDRPDKDWPLTDCISFVVMEEHKIVEALTADKHFQQAGFVTLFPTT